MAIGTAATDLHELQLVCPRAAVEATDEALQALDALSVTSEDADAGTMAEDAQFGEPSEAPPTAAWARTRMRALFADADAATEAAGFITRQDFFAHGVVQAIVPVPQQDWVRLTQAQFEPVCIQPDFWIVPSWHEVPATARRVIRLDPGLAFGTGTHPTTRMCLRWISEHPPTAQRVLDYGCGSGILAIAAARYGARTIHAVDTDPAAVQATKANAAANHVALMAGRPDSAQDKYDLVVANILASPLMVLAPVLCSLVASHGRLLLSGVLHEQVQALQQAYQPWMTLRIVDRHEAWILLAGRLNQSRPPADYNL